MTYEAGQTTKINSKQSVFITARKFAGNAVWILLCPDD